jgi:hypothetical protein
MIEDFPTVASLSEDLQISGTSLTVLPAEMSGGH